MPDIQIDFSRLITAAQKEAEATAARDGKVAAAVQAHIDDLARSWSYNDAATLAGYAASAVPKWAAEAAALIAWRDAIWLQVYGYQTAPETAPAMIEDLIAALPPITRP